MHFRARHAQVVCGSEEAARMGLLRGLDVDGEVVPSGTAVEPGTLLLTSAAGLPTCTGCGSPPRP
jgi:molybdenum transport protein